MWFCRVIAYRLCDIFLVRKAQDTDYQISQCSHNAGSCFSANTTAVFLKGHIADIMQFVFNTPMSSVEIEQSLRGCFVRRKTGYTKSNVTAKYFAFQISCYALNSDHLLVIREITIALQHCAAVDVTDFYAPVPFVYCFMLRGEKPPCGGFRYRP